MELRYICRNFTSSKEQYLITFKFLSMKYSIVVEEWNMQDGYDNGERKYYESKEEAEFESIKTDAKRFEGDKYQYTLWEHNEEGDESEWLDSFTSSSNELI